MEELLFELKDVESTPSVQDHAGTGKTCGKCMHGVRSHRYREDWIYCESRPSRRTQFGLLRVRSRQAACELFSNSDLGRSRLPNTKKGEKEQ